MRFATRCVVPLVGLTLMAVLPIVSPPAASAASITLPATVTAANWTVAPNISPSIDVEQQGVSCVTSTFCMAVGTSGLSDGETSAPVAQMWNGTSWASVTVQLPAHPGSNLSAVSCVSTTWCIAVGTTDIQSSTNQTLIEQWNGSQFSVVPVTSPSNLSFLNGVSCLSTTFCMAVGASTFTSSLFAQWNGTSWSFTTQPEPQGLDLPNLAAVSCGATTNCMAVGAANAPGTGGTDTLAYHWNGSTWQGTLTVLQPAPFNGNFFKSVSCVGKFFCAAAGDFYNTNSAASFLGATPLVETWNNISWTMATLPATPGVGDGLNGISCFSATSCTAAGYTATDPSLETLNSATLALTWDGQTWAVQHTPNSSINPTTSYFIAVDCLTNWACMAVGAATNATPGPGGGSTSQAFAAWAPIARSGYRFVAADGGIFRYGAGAPFLGSMGGMHLNAPIVAMAVMPGGDGYYLVASDGGIFPFGSAKFWGSTGNIHLNKPIVGMAITADGAGYWLVASDGGIFAFGDAGFFGSAGGTHLNKPIVGMAATPNGLGYYLVASDGGVFNYGNARFEGSTGALTLNKPIVGMAVPVAGGYYLVASDGGIFAFPAKGGPPFLGSTGALTLNKPIVGMTTAAGGYYLSGSDGGIFTFPHGGTPPFLGSTGNITLNAPIVGIAG